MSESIFYSKKRKGNERRITLQTYTGLVGKQPTKEKRLKMKILMTLSGQKTAGAPDWILNTTEFVMKNHDPVSPEVNFSGFDIEFSAEQLFGDKSVKITKAKMRGFQIFEQGVSDTPDIVMTFLLYAPFSGKLNNWCGQMAGEEFWAKFTQIDEPQEEEAGDEDDQEEFALESEEPTDDSEEEIEEDSSGEEEEEIPD